MRPRSARISSSRWSASPTWAPWRTTSAPYSRQAATFEATAPAGITTVIGTPASRAAHAYAWPALPAEIVIAPRRRSSGVSEAILASAARGLKEPVFWRCSALRYRRPSARAAPELWPATRAAVADDSIGVWWMRVPSRLRVSRIAAREMGPWLTRGVCASAGCAREGSRPAGQAIGFACAIWSRLPLPSSNTARITGPMSAGSCVNRTP